MARLEREQTERDADISDEDELLRESSAAAAERVQQFTTIKELLTATALGTS
jgi:hypothetical protein